MVAHRNHVQNAAQSQSQMSSFLQQSKRRTETSDSRFARVIFEIRLQIAAQLRALGARNAVLPATRDAVSEYRTSSQKRIDDSHLSVRLQRGLAAYVGLVNPDGASANPNTHRSDQANAQHSTSQTNNLLASNKVTKCASE